VREAADVEPAPRLGRQLVWYFGGLLAVYAVSLAVFWPPQGEQPNEAIFLLIMFAPTVGGCWPGSSAVGASGGDDRVGG
jgi:hypothetical protein